MEQEQALVFLDAWGTGEELVKEPWKGYAYAIEDYAPDWINEDLPESVRDHHGGIVTVLSVDFPEVEGYRVIVSGAIGERECPYLEQHEEGATCPLCGGDDYIYWGEEWHFYVLVPEGEKDDD